MSKPKDDIAIEREQAWIGDAVLSLIARQWILDQAGRMDGDSLTRLTSNQFLACFGNPTAVEARIGRTYADHGFEAARQLIEREFIPLFLKQEAKRNRR